MSGDHKQIALLGGGPAALYLFKKLLESPSDDYELHIFEKNAKLGAGMPYSRDGANEEHVTNVSGNEIPQLVQTVEDWLEKSNSPLIHQFGITVENYNEFKVLPRLLFGEYLCAQFELLKKAAKEKGIKYIIHLNTPVNDLIDQGEHEKVRVLTEKDDYLFDAVVICTGHKWPCRHEEKVTGYYDSPYPPSKLAQTINHPIALRGSSLTAFDALRTLSRNNGKYVKNEKGRLRFILNQDSPQFKIVLHSIDGLLPAIRIHLDQTNLSEYTGMSENEIRAYRDRNNGFVSLDELFEHKFKAPFKEKDPAFYSRIKDMNLEDFVDDMMAFRESIDPFTLFKAEYVEAERSIRRQQPVHWKEMLAVLSYTVNYPAKYFSAEDMLRLKRILMPLISIVIAFVPQSSAEELITLHEAGVLTIIPVDRSSTVEAGEKEGITYTYTDEQGKRVSVYYKMFVDCIGQQPLSIGDIPFKGLLEKHTVCQAKLCFRSAEEAIRLMNEGDENVQRDRNGAYYLKVPGIMINDHFQVVDSYGAYNDRIYVMAVPFIGGVNPDYSGLDFCEAASATIIRQLLPASVDVRVDHLT